VVVDGHKTESSTAFSASSSSSSTTSEYNSSESSGHEESSSSSTFDFTWGPDDIWEFASGSGTESSSGWSHSSGSTIWNTSDSGDGWSIDKNYSDIESSGSSWTYSASLQPDEFGALAVVHSDRTETEDAARDLTASYTSSSGDGSSSTSESYSYHEGLQWQSTTTTTEDLDAEGNLSSSTSSSYSESGSGTVSDDSSWEDEWDGSGSSQLDDRYSYTQANDDPPVNHVSGEDVETASGSGSSSDAYSATVETTTWHDGHYSRLLEDFPTDFWTPWGSLSTMSGGENFSTLAGQSSLALIGSVSLAGSLPRSDEPYVIRDSQGRYATLVDADGGATRFTYDAAGNLASVTDPDGNTTAWVYDAEGNVIEAAGPAAVDMTVPSVVDLIHATQSDWLAESAVEEDLAMLAGLCYDGATAGDAEVCCDLASSPTSATDPTGSQPWTTEGVSDLLRRFNPKFWKVWTRTGTIVGDSAQNWWNYAFHGWNWPGLTVTYRYDLHVESITAHVPPDWTSLQVATFICQQLAGNPKLRTAILEESRDWNDRASELVAGRRAEYAKACNQIAEALTTIVEAGVSIIPGGTFVVSVHQAFEGHYVAAAIGAIGVLPWAKMTEAVAAKIVFSDGSQLLIGRDAVQAIQKMGAGEQALLKTEIAASKSAKEASSVLKRFLDLSYEAHHLLPKTQKFAQRFADAGLTVDEYILYIEQHAHRLKPSGLHTVSGGNWNKVWEDFLKQPRTKEEILA